MQLDSGRNLVRRENRQFKPVGHPEIRSVFQKIESSLEVILNFRYLLIFSIISILAWHTAFGEEAEGPVILSPDLTVKQEIRDPEQVFGFVFIDADKVASITINDEEMTFEAAETVMIMRKFKFSQGKSLLHVYAEDTKGNGSERTFLIGYGDKELEFVPVTGKETDGPELTWKADVKGGFEIDSNPSSDMSSAIEEFDGVVDDEEQTDTRLTLEGIVSAEYGKFNAVGGISALHYSKTENKYLQTIMMFGGLGYKSYLSRGRSWMLDAMFTDINTGGYDYAMIQSISPGIEFRSRGKRGEYRSLVLAMDLIYKLFAIESRTDAFQGTLKYDFNSLDQTKHNLFRNGFAMGTSTEGTESSEYTFARLDFDWKNLWDSGMRVDFGFGIEHRTFANDTARSPDAKIIALGSKHIDIPFRFEAGIGWKFSESLKAMLNAKYVFNLSNDVPYKRLISGATVSAVF